VDQETWGLPGAGKSLRWRGYKKEVFHGAAPPSEWHTENMHANWGLLEGGES